jgi:HEAT repeat protein
MIGRILSSTALAVCLLSAGVAADDGPITQPASRPMVSAGGRAASHGSGPASMPDEDGGQEPSSSTRPGRPTSATAAAGSAGGLAGMSEAEVNRLVEIAQQDKLMREVILQQYPELEALLKGIPAASRPAGDPGPLAAGDEGPKGTSPASRPATDGGKGLSAEGRRKKAEALIADLAGASPKDLAAIEQELLGVGAEAMVPLKLAELSENFELRQRAGATASRLRWRLACGEAMLKREPDLLAVMSGEDAHARAVFVDRIAADAGAGAVGFLGECLADPQPFVRQRAIDGLVGVCQGDHPGRNTPDELRQRVVRILEGALDDDEDRNIRLLAIGAMTKIGAVDVDRLAKLLGDDSLEVRATVIRAMGFSGDGKAVRHIKPLLKDPQWRVRGAALEALAKLVRDNKGDLVAADLANCLNDPEPYISDLAAKVVVDIADSQPLSDEQVSRMLDGNSALQAVTALKAAYRYNAPGFRAVLLKATSHRLPDVAGQAMGMIASIYLSDSLGEDIPSYRRDDSHQAADDTRGRDRLPADLTKEVARNLSRADSSYLRAFAAAILYRSGADQGEEVLKALREGLKDPEVSVRYRTMAGIVEKPQPLMGAFDVIAASRVEYLTRPAIDVMAGLQDGNYAPRLLEMAANADLDNHSLMRALLLSGDPNGFDLVLAKAAKAESYSRRQLAETFKNSPGPRPVQFVSEMIKEEKNESDREQLVEVMITLTDPSAKEALTSFLEDKKLTGRNILPKVMARLAELDPAGGAERFRKLLESSDRDAQESAVQSLLQTKPSKEMVAVILEAATKAPPDGNRIADAWYQLIGWVPADDLHGDFLPALGRLNFAAQDALLGRIARDLNERDLLPLASASVQNPFMRMWSSALVGQLTADRPDLRRSLADKMDSGQVSLPSVLIAAGDWEEAPGILDVFLSDGRPEVSSAAAAGLSFYLLGHSASPLTDAMREALRRTIAAKDAIAAYLAAEALGLHDPNALRQIEPNSITASTAALRLAVAWGKDIPPNLQAVVAATLSKNAGPTATQLAARAAADNWQDSYSSHLDNLEYRVDPRLLARLVLAAKKPNLLRQGPRGYLGFNVFLGASQQVRREMIAQARKEDDFHLFSQFATWIDKPEKGDLVRLLKAATTGSSGNGDGYPYTMLPDWPDRWGALPEDPEVIKLIAADKQIGVAAAVLAAVQWDSNDGHAALMKAATTVPRKGASSSRSGQLQMIAVKGLRLCGRPADANALVEAWKKFDLEDYQQREVRKEMLGLIASLSPPEAMKLVAAPPSGGREDNDLRTLAAELAFLFADSKGWDASASHSEPSVGGARLDALRQLKSAGQRRPTGASPDATADEWTALLAPPWGSASSPDTGFGSDLPLLGDAKAQAAGILAQFIAQAKEIDRILAEEAQDNSDRQSSLFARDGGARGWSAQDKTPAGRQAQEILQRLVAESRPDGFYSGQAGFFPVGLYLEGDRVAGALAPLLAHESLRTRSTAMRAAAAWGAVELSDAIAAHLESNNAECLEAAWALASLGGREAVEPVAKAYRNHPDFDTRVNLACLLRMLGDDRRGADISRAVSLATIRRFRMKFLSPQQPRQGILGQYRGRYDSAEGGAEACLLPWMSVLQMAAPDLLASTMKQFPVFPADVEEEPAQSAEDPQGRTPGTRIDLSDLRLNAPGMLISHRSQTNGLPVPCLSSNSGHSYSRSRDWMSADEQIGLPFISLPAAEQSMEALCFVQFADRSSTPVDLLAHWRLWWSANKNGSRGEWWKQATAQAAAELTHEKWWYRMLAARRLARLTGRAEAIPNPFDLAAWASLQERHGQWMARHGQEDPRLWLVEAALEAKVLDPAGKARLLGEAPGVSQPWEPAAWLEALVRMAGSGKHPLAAAALLQLETWPDRAQLLRACLPWQQSPVEELRVWARRELQQAMGKRLIFFTQADCPLPAATEPASAPQ